MRNFTWVCFWCRTAYRRAFMARNVRCRSCGQPCEYLSDITSVPSRLRVREWDALRETFYRRLRAYRLGEQKRRVHRIHDLKHEIARLESLPANDFRVDRLKRLRTELEQLRPGHPPRVAMEE